MKPSTVMSIAAVYATLCLFYFLPVAVGHKIIFPLLFLTLLSVRMQSWPVLSAMLFSALGDYAGSCHSFLWQMSSFALAHVAFVIAFVSRILQSPVRWQRPSVAVCALLCLGAYLAVSQTIFPHVTNAAFHAGVSVYTALILLMLLSAWTTGDRLLATGALLFVVSDTLLAWNKFVSPLPDSRYWILVPYFTAQFLLFIRSAAYRRQQSEAA